MWGYNMNYQVEMEKQLQNLKGTPKLLLHACCAPCSSYVLSTLTNFFDITIYYYNPNIFPKEEFTKRYLELDKFIKEYPFIHDVSLEEGEYNYDDYKKISKGLEEEKEGGKRCYNCYKLRMEKSFIYAKKNGFDYVTTTLSISPYKNVNWINEIGKELEQKYGIKYLYADFKKKNGYKKSIEFSKEYNLYRQDYCGCVYSKRDREKKEVQIES